MKHVFKDSRLQFPFNSGSSHHYCTYGTSESRASMVATDIAAGYMNANSDARRTVWSTIAVYVVPHPEKAGLYMVEDRSRR